jgi:hypothetical protein
MRVYFATKSRRAAWISALIEAGVPIASSWHGWSFNTDDGVEPGVDAWAEHSARCLREASECDVTIIYAEKGDVHFGAIAEAAACLSHDRTLFMVAPHHDWSFLRHHRNFRSFDTLAAAIQAVLAIERGERMRAA